MSQICPSTNACIHRRPPIGRLDHLDYGIIVLLLAGTLGLYAQVRNFEYLRFDDPLYVSQNWHVISGVNADSLRYALTAVVSSNWHPLTLLVEMCVAQLFGNSPAAFHLLCAGLHAVNVVLLYLFFRSNSRFRWASMGAALFWGWHPLRAESVAWIGELKDVLCGFFWLLTLLAFARYRHRPGMGRYLLVVLCTALALLSKPMAVTLPATLLLLNVWPLRFEHEILNRRWWTHRLLEQIPLLMLCIVVSRIALHTQQRTGATGSLSVFPISLRITNALFSYLRYISGQLVPIHLGLLYPHPGMLGRAVPFYQLGSAAIVLAIISWGAWNNRKSKPYLLVGWLWFVGTMIPVLGLVEIGQAAMADRYTYIPGIGLTIALAWLISDWASSQKNRRIPVVLFALAALLGMLTLCSQQISYWRDSHSIVAHSNQVIPDNFVAQASLSMDATAAGNIPDAIALARSAAALAPQLEEVHHALAIALQAGGRSDEALREYAIAIQANPLDPGVRVDVGRFLASQNKLAAAVKQFEKAIELAPDVPAAHHNLAAVLVLQGDYDRAIPQWKIAVQLNPHFGAAHGLLADALRLRGDRAGAVEHYQAAILAGETNSQWKANLVWERCIDPASPPQQIQQLISIAQQACDQTNQQSPFPIYAYSLALARLGRFDDAAEQAKHALQLAQLAHQSEMAKAIMLRLEAYKRGSVTVTPKASVLLNNRLYLFNNLPNLDHFRLGGSAFFQFNFSLF